MTPEEAAKKYTKPDGTIELPADIIITPPKRTYRTSNRVDRRKAEKAWRKFNDKP